VPERREIPDVPLLLAVLFLVSMGLVLIYSSSAILAMGKMDDAYFFIKRQVVAMVLGCCAMWVAYKSDSARVRSWALPLTGLSLLLLALVLVPGLGRKVGGARRWLDLGFMSFQPSELFKVALVLFAADRLAVNGDAEQFMKRGVFPVAAVTGLACALLMLEPDFGATVIAASICAAMLFYAGLPLWHFVLPAAAGAAAAFYMVTSSAYRMRRVAVFLDPWKDPQGAGFQMVHSMMAFGAGGLLGAGLGEGRQKLFYLPEPHTDFIFSTAGEELGFLGCLLIVAAYGIVLWRGFVIALKTRDDFVRLASAGLTALLGIQVVINLFVVLGLAPTKGTTLPFLSYGGTAMMVNLAVVGLLLNFSRQR
jgi:cell division protein FtsW